MWSSGWPSCRRAREHPGAWGATCFGATRLPRGCDYEGGIVKKLLMLGAALAALAIPAGASASTITQVMHGLDNAKGLAFGPEGALYVAEADAAARLPGSAGRARGLDLGLRCYGATGAISRYWHGKQERIVTGLPSLENPAFAGPAAGPQHVSFQGRGGMYVTIGFGGDPSARDEFFPGLGFSQLSKITLLGAAHSVADIGGYEAGEQSGRPAGRYQRLRGARVAGPSARDRCRGQFAPRRSRQRLDLDGDDIPKGNRRVRSGLPGSDGSSARP